MRQPDQIRSVFRMTQAKLTRRSTGRCLRRISALSNPLHLAPPDPPGGNTRWKQIRTIRYLLDFTTDFCL